MDESHDDLEGIGENGVAVVASLDGLDEDVSATCLDSQTHGVLEHPVVETTLEHLEKIQNYIFLSISKNVFKIDKNSLDSKPLLDEKKQSFVT